MAYGLAQLQDLLFAAQLRARGSCYSCRWRLLTLCQQLAFGNQTCKKSSINESVNGKIFYERENHLEKKSTCDMLMKKSSKHGGVSIATFAFQFFKFQ